MSPHKERKHSKFSASGSERWLNCAPSVALEEKSPPSPDNEWSIDGTKTHEVHEELLIMYNEGVPLTASNIAKRVPHKEPDRILRAMKSVKLIIETANQYGCEIIPESRIDQAFIHPEMFGTCDAILPQHFGRLHVFDYKDGSGHIVDAEENTQMIQYALGWADHFDWNFEDVEVHICQPKAGKTWHKSWIISIEELKTKWVPIFFKGASRAEKHQRGEIVYAFKKGSWCHWCRAKAICPLQNESKFQKVTDRFNTPIEEQKGGKHGKQEKGKKESYEAQDGFEENEAQSVFEETDGETFFGAEGSEDFY